jgi:hypothetical protein
MRKSRSLLATLFATAILPGAFCFSRVGHETIAELAYQSPQLSAKAKSAIDQLIATSDPLNPGNPEAIGDVAEWPDEIKPSGIYGKEPWAIAFSTAHPNNTKWHFVNFPLGSPRYDSTQVAYALDTDIVHTIKSCIGVLEGTGTFEGFSKIDALRYLFHLVGDAHQPLHTVAGYFNVTVPAHPKLLSGAKKIPATAWKDNGGNYLYYSDQAELHAAWDYDIVNAIAGNNTDQLVTALTPSIKSTNYVTTGDYHNWIEAWVSDSIIVARTAYAPIKFGAYGSFPVPGQSWLETEIKITLPPTYIQAQAGTARAQIIKAATHLLQLLNAIQWN